MVITVDDKVPSTESAANIEYRQIEFKFECFSNFEIFAHLISLANEVRVVCNTYC